MIYEINAMELRKEVGHYLNEVKYGHNSYIIKRNNEEMCAIIDMQLFAKLKKLDENYQIFKQHMHELGEELSDEEVTELANDAVKFARNKKIS